MIFVITGYEAFSLGNMVKAFLPVRNIYTGFSSCYLVFFLFIPFLNILVRNMNEKQHIKLLLLCSFLYIFLGTMPKFGVTMNYVSWFIVLYFIGSYIRLYDKKIFSSVYIWGIITVVVLLLSVASVIIMTYIKPSHFGSYYFVADSNKVLGVVLALSAFMFFKNVNIKNSRFINTTAASCFGVLLAHSNSETMRNWLWKDLLNNVGMYNSDYLIVHALGSVLAVYIICTLIDYARIRFIEKPFFRIWDKYYDRISEKYRKIEMKSCNKLNIKN